MIRCVFVVAFICTIWVSLVQGKTNCDKLGVNFYDFIGCTKENTGGDCPSYNCKYERQPGKCLFNGKVLSPSEFPDVGSLCRFGCFCSASNDTKGSFVCAQGGCGFLGRPVEEGCRLEYELDKCCGQQNCERSTITCESNGKTYKEGERIYFKDQCFQCICTKDFNGKFDSDSCQRQPCDAEIEYQEQIENNCAPVYYKRDGNEALCCPSTFVCPSEDDKIIKSEESDTSLTCRYGDKTYKSDVTFTKSIHQYGRTREV
ncbi:hypothetical protein AMK59_2068, partial [Oryctes borbonicus]